MYISVGLSETFHFLKTIIVTSPGPSWVPLHNISIRGVSLGPNYSPKTIDNWQLIKSGQEVNWENTIVLLEFGRCGWKSVLSMTNHYFLGQEWIWDNTGLQNIKSLFKCIVWIKIFPSTCCPIFQFVKIDRRNNKKCTLSTNKNTKEFVEILPLWTPGPNTNTIHLLICEY